jgi:acyl-coenzyme A thioesterase PaaI-like protein
MEIMTHQKIDQKLCGRPLEVAEGSSRIQMQTLDCMAADASGLVHGGFIFGLADYAAMLAVNHPNVVLGAAEAKFLKPVKVNETVVAQGAVQERQGKKQIVAVKVLKGDETVFQGTFTCFALEQHVLG